MWNAGKKIHTLRDKKKKYSNTRVVRKKNSERNNPRKYGRLLSFFLTYTRKPDQLLSFISEVDFVSVLFFIDTFLTKLNSA